MARRSKLEPRVPRHRIWEVDERDALDGNAIDELGAMFAHVEPEPLPRFVEPMLATSADLPPEGTGWRLELKWDGCRGQLIVDRGEWRVRSRPGRCVNAAFTELSTLADDIQGVGH